MYVFFVTSGNNVGLEAGNNIEYNDTNFLKVPFLVSLVLYAVGFVALW